MTLYTPIVLILIHYILVFFFFVKTWIHVNLQRCLFFLNNKTWFIGITTRRYTYALYYIRVHIVPRSRPNGNPGTCRPCLENLTSRWRARSVYSQRGLPRHARTFDFNSRVSRHIWSTTITRPLWHAHAWTFAKTVPGVHMSSRRASRRYLQTIRFNYYMTFYLLIPRATVISE